MPDPTLTRDEFERRFKERFQDVAFKDLGPEVEALARAAWQTYDESRKSSAEDPAGPEFKHPEENLSREWLRTRAQIQAAQAAQQDRQGPDCFLIINASPRSEWTCPGEMSKSFRLVDEAKAALEAQAASLPDGRAPAVQVLDLSRLTSEFGRQIHPCKSCVSTAMPLCHWPCSCYPNHALGQVHDWMNDIYPLWVRAHGIMIITPVHWYQVPSTFKLMMDRLVCADGGNPDPTSTHGKDAEAAKKIEARGWDFPKHLGGRLFSVFVHGDAGGADHVRQSLADWLTDIGMDAAGPQAVTDRYIGYLQDYYSSHTALDEDAAVQTEVRNAARTLGLAVRARREGQFAVRPTGGKDPRPK